MACSIINDRWPVLTANNTAMLLIFSINKVNSILWFCNYKCNAAPLIDAATVLMKVRTYVKY